MRAFLFIVTFDSPALLLHWFWCLPNFDPYSILAFLSNSLWHSHTNISFWCVSSFLFLFLIYLHYLSTGSGAYPIPALAPLAFPVHSSWHSHPNISFWCASSFLFLFFIYLHYFSTGFGAYPIPALDPLVFPVYSRWHSLQNHFILMWAFLLICIFNSPALLLL